MKPRFDFPTLALDPATNTGVADSYGLLTTWHLSGAGAGYHYGAGLVDLRRRIIKRWKAYPFQRIVVELASIASIKSGKTAARLAALHGAICDAAYMLGKLPVRTVQPTKLKKFATGNGRADKADMITFAKGQGADPHDDNQADAWHLLQWARCEWDVSGPTIELKEKEKPF